MFGFSLDAERVELALESSFINAISLQGNRVDGVRSDAGEMSLPLIKLLIEGNIFESVTSICSISVGSVCTELACMWRAICSTLSESNVTIDAGVIAVDDAILRLPPNEAATISNTPCAQVDNFGGIVSALFVIEVLTNDTFSTCCEGCWNCSAKRIQGLTGAGVSDKDLRIESDLLLFADLRIEAELRIEARVLRIGTELRNGVRNDARARHPRLSFR